MWFYVVFGAGRETKTEVILSDVVKLPPGKRETPREPERARERPRELENFGLGPFKKDKVLLPVSTCYWVILVDMAEVTLGVSFTQFYSGLLGFTQVWSED